MFPNEMIILMAIAVTQDSGKKLLTRPMDVTSEYIGYLYDSLVRRGYLKGNRSRGYHLSLKGRKSLFEFLHENKTRIKDILKTLQQLGVDIGQEKDKQAKEAIQVK